MGGFSYNCMLRYTPVFIKRPTQHTVLDDEILIVISSNYRSLLCTKSVSLIPQNHPASESRG